VVGVDTGGTFTDFVARLPSGWVALKVPSTPRAPERAVLEGLARLGASRATLVRHGSTVATNTLLERKGARVVMLTNRGFEDLLEIGRQDRPDLYALAPRRVPPLVPRERRVGVRARRGPDGRAQVPLLDAEVRRAIARARRLRPEALVIGLLHSYAAPGDERRLARAARQLGVPVTASSELCPEIREYERFATAVVNAYLEPRVARYMDALLKACGPRLEIVLSHGGGVPARAALREPVRQLLSGPAAGLGAAFRAARQAGFRAALTLDVGGTSTDVAFARDRLPRRRARDVAGFPILLPMLDVHTVGAGGGSIAAIDAGGLLAVGPRSAGADPGPACYGRGGPATVTDAMVVLGRLPTAALGDGAISIRPERAGAALARLARGLGVGSALEAARAVVAVANARMEAALRRVSVERGHDPRTAVLVAFGGAGGLHACELAEALGAAGVVFPAHAGVLSALGAALVPERYERSRSVMRPAAAGTAIRREAQRLARAIQRRFTRAGARVSSHSVLARYAGQSHELEIPLSAGDLEGRFHEEHRRAYGFAREGEPVEIVTVDVWGAVAASDAAHPRAPRSRRAAPLRRAPVAVGRAVRAVPVWDFDALGAGDKVRGPAIVLQSGATLWLEPRWTGRLHASGALVLERSER
jgi:N-methylhydantoinase A